MRNINIKAGDFLDSATGTTAELNYISGLNRGTLVLNLRLDNNDASFGYKSFQLEGISPVDILYLSSLFNELVSKIKEK